MKKFLSVLMILTVLLSCCACSGKPKEDKANQLDFPTYEEMLVIIEEEQKNSQTPPEVLYGMIDQSVPVDGVYKIWNADGVKMMADHPDAKFEFLCSIDMEGAVLRPIGTADKPFTGSINGVNCILSNFTVEATDDGYLGFIGVNNGAIYNISLTEVTLVAKENTKYMGGIAGVSNTEITRCTVKGTMNVPAAANDAYCGSIMGQGNSANVINSVADVDIIYSASGSAAIGGVAGTATNCRMEFTESYGDLVITGSNKTVGLVAGAVKDISLYTVAFLGEKNTVDDKLFENYFGNEENVEFETILVRDNKANPLPENVQKLRDIVEQRMRDMGTIEWSTSENLYHDCVCQLGVCFGAYKPGMLHRGIPYNHKGGSLARFKYCMEDIGNDHYIAADWTYNIDSYDGFDLYIGNDCSGAVQNAWWAVSNSTDILSCQYMQTSWNRGTIAVGDWPSDITVADGKKSEEVICEAAGSEVMYAAYAQMRKGDAIMHVGKDGNHTRMVASDAVVVRDENGTINGNYSYVLCHEQGAPAVMDPYFCSWRIDYQYTFANMFLGGYLPYTCEELVTGEMEPVECELVNGTDGYSGMFAGTVEANYRLECVTLKVTDSKGKVAFEHTMWVGADRSSEFGGNRDNGIRNYHEDYNMANFAVPLQNVQFVLGESYNYTISAYLAVDETFTVGEGSFVYGQA